VKFSIVTLGDLNVDVKISGLPILFRELTSDTLIPHPTIEMVLGGSGVNFARFAGETGFESYFIGKVGNDNQGQYAIEAIKGFNIQPFIKIDNEFPTGIAVILRDANSIRFLVNKNPNANRMLAVHEIREYADLITQRDILYISGYCLMHSPRKEATKCAMKMAHNNGVFIVLDVVPHEIYKHYSFDEFKTVTHGVNLLISEVATTRRFLGLGHKDEVIDDCIVKETIMNLRGLYDNYILRFGIGNCEEQVVIKNTKEKWEHTGYVQAADKRGFGDRLTVKTLKEIFFPVDC